MRNSSVLTLLYFLRPYPGFMGGILVATLLASFLEGLNVAAFFPVLESLLNGEGPRPIRGGVLRVLQGMGAIFPVRDPIVAAVLLLVAIALIKSGAVFLKETLVAVASGTVSHDLKGRLMERYSACLYPFFLEQKQGKLLYQLSTGASRVGILLQKIAQGLADGLKAVAIGALLMITLPQLTLIIALMGLGYYGLTHYLSRKVSYHTGQGRVMAGAEQTSIANEFLTGIHQMMVFGTTASWVQRFRKQSERFRNLFVQDAIWLSLPKILLELVSVGVLSALILRLHFQEPVTFRQDLPLIGLFAFALMKLLPALSGIGQIRMEVLNLLADAEGIHEILTQIPVRRQGGNRIFTGLKREIRLDRVGFSHKEREWLLKDLTVAFEKGKLTAIVGSSGSGKTTLVNLVLGLLEPREGRILVDGADLKEYTQQTWRRSIGFVSQTPFICHASVAHNIAFGRTGHSLASIQRAAEVANAHRFIEQLPQRYETVVGERGMKLSGGEQQRIAIARALLTDPEILIFDEATSSLDRISERSVQEAIERVLSDRTVILVAHRLSTVHRADRIVVLEEGRVVEQGRHEELLSGQGRYFQLIASGRG